MTAVPLGASPHLFGLTALAVSGLVIAASGVPLRQVVFVTPARLLFGRGARGRQVLALITLTLAVASLVVQGAVSRSAGLEAEAALGTLAEDTVVFASADGLSDARAFTSLTRADLAAIETSGLVKEGELFYIRGFAVGEIAHSGETFITTFRVFDGVLPTIGGASLSAGRWFEPEALEVVLGQTLAQTIFGTDDPVGQSLTLFGRDWQVVGIAKAGNVGLPGLGAADDLFMPGSQVRPAGFGMVAGSAKHVDPEAVARFLTERYDAERFRPIVMHSAASALPTLSASLQQMERIYTVLSGALLLLAAFALFMQALTEVSRRVHEIGLRRALGATPQGLLWQFQGEALRLGVLAGLLGLALGAGVAYALASVQGYAFALEPRGLVAVLGAVLIIPSLTVALPQLAAVRYAPAALLGA